MAVDAPPAEQATAVERPIEEKAGAEVDAPVDTNRPEQRHVSQLVINLKPSPEKDQVTNKPMTETQL